MPVSYDDIAGQQVGRLGNLSDSIFGVAMTLLILEIHVPPDYIKTERDLWEAIFALSPRLLVYLMSFLTLGIFWNAQEAQLSRLARGDRKLTWIHIAFLATVALTPLSTAIEENFIHFRVALAVFWLNLLLLGMTLYASWRYASAMGLLRNDVSREEQYVIRRRIILAEELYAAAFALGVFSTLWSIAAIVMVQLALALLPTIRWLKRVAPLGRGHSHHREP
ncbi:MAG TPA: TMEM175 family protein [Terriglobales bacterium]|nr:TMEM175 family protein [Terriglobales bacterium]